MLEGKISSREEADRLIIWLTSRMCLFGLTNLDVLGWKVTQTK